MASHNFPGTVTSVSASKLHTFSKTRQDSILLVKGKGVQGDAHFGSTVKHRSRVLKDPTQPNLRQVHLLHEELFDELQARGFTISPGMLGENILTKGIDLIALPEGMRLHIGPSAVVEVTGLRNPCRQLDELKRGLMSALIDRRSDGTLSRNAGVMGIVICGGEVRKGDAIALDGSTARNASLQVV